MTCYLSMPLVFRIVQSLLAAITIILSVDMIATIYSKEIVRFYIENINRIESVPVDPAIEGVPTRVSTHVYLDVRKSLGSISEIAESHDTPYEAYWGNYSKNPDQLIGQYFYGRIVEEKVIPIMMDATGLMAIPFVCFLLVLINRYHSYKKPLSEFSNSLRNTTADCAILLIVTIFLFSLIYMFPSNSQSSSKKNIAYIPVIALVYASFLLAVSMSKPLSLFFRANQTDKKTGQDR